MRPTKNNKEHIKQKYTYSYEYIQVYLTPELKYSLLWGKKEVAKIEEVNKTHRAGEACEM